MQGERSRMSHHTIALTMALIAAADKEQQHQPAESLAVHVFADGETEKLPDEHRRNRDRRSDEAVAGDLARGDEQGQSADVAEREDRRDRRPKRGSRELAGLQGEDQWRAVRRQRRGEDTPETKPVP